jgi:hypothetical protein
VRPQFSGLEHLPVPPPDERRVVLVIIDGVRHRELQGRALDDNRRPVRTADLFPNLSVLRRSGVYVSRLAISNPAGVSPPGYADIFSGRRQEKILNNSPAPDDLHSHYPTLFQALRSMPGATADSVALITAWSPLCRLAVSSPPALQDDFFRSCGLRVPPTPAVSAAPTDPAAPQPVGSQPFFFKPEIYGGSRADSDTFLEVLQELPRRHPRLSVIQFVDADEEAHLQRRVQRRAGQHYGIFHYHQALRASDYYIGRIWSHLQQDRAFANKTYLIVTTDHGRDDYPEPDQWTVHGHCVTEHKARRPCAGCSQIFALAIGPGLRPQVVKKNYDHTSLAPTIAHLLGSHLDTATGPLMPELLPGAPAPQPPPKPAQPAQPPSPSR